MDVSQIGTAAIALGAGNRTSGAGSLHQGRELQVIGVGESGLFATDGARTDPFLNRMRAILDDAVFQRPGF